MADVSVDVDVNDFLWACNKREIDEVKEWFEEHSTYSLTDTNTELYTALLKISNAELQLTKEDEDSIIALAKKLV